MYQIGATDVATLKAEFSEALIKRKHVQVGGSVGCCVG